MSQRGELKNWLTRLVVALVLPAVTGCEFVANHSLTGKLWSEDFAAPIRHFPDTNSPPVFFQTKDGKDVLVQYLERRDFETETKARAYLLYQNVGSTEAGKLPEFTNPRNVRLLGAITVTTDSAAAPDAGDESLRAVLKPDRLSFTLVSKGREIGSYTLPTYQTRGRQTERLLLTPFAFTGDVVIGGAIVGSVVGVIVIYAVVASHASE